MEKHPNPKDVQWETVLQCTLDKVDMYHALSGSTDQPRLFHYSETMDAGVFFIFLNLESIGKVLLRVKPIGTQEQICSTGNGNVIIWDEIMYGFCSHCNQCLPRVQVCADCKVEQYCKRKCQRQHWDEGHKEECKQLWFYVKQPDEEQERYASAFIQDVIDRKRKHVQDLAEAPAVDQLQWMDAAQQDPSFNWQPDRENELPDEHDLSKNDDRSPKKIRVIEN
ncbi:hypothetical protein EDD86DRAFT_197288 [Gorgonomyces haynaldii]|nr:hypothetical protein EDD86DRAFT_197288 [Gorgonomyces haynaldii]